MRRIPQRSPQTRPLGNMVTVRTKVTDQLYAVNVGGRLGQAELMYYTGGRPLAPGERVHATWHEDQRTWMASGVGIGLDVGDPADVFPDMIIAAGADDGHWSYQTDSAFSAAAGNILLSSAGGTDFSGFFRFDDVPLDQGQVVPPLRLRFVNSTVDGLFPPTQNMRVACVDEDDAAAPTTALEASADWDGRVATEVIWDAVPWAAGILYTNDLSPTIQNVINRGAWANGNALLFVIYGEDITPAITTTAPTSYDGTAADAAQLQTFMLPVDPTDPGTRVLKFYVSGGLGVASHPERLHVPFDGVITRVTATVGTAPTGASLIVDVNLGGTTIYTTQANRPTIAVTEQDALNVTAPDVTEVSKDDVLTLDVDQIGSGAAGSDLVVLVSIAGA